MSKLKVTAVSYLNTKPFLYGLLNHPIQSQIDLSLDIPSRCAEKLQDGSVDIGLVPVAVIPYLDTPHIVSDYCIGSDGPVKTVCIFANQPIEETEELLLDYHSRTSVQLAQILLRKYWNIQPRISAAQPGFEYHLRSGQAAVVIGDRTIELFDQYTYTYDLSTAWKDLTGLPFVFAAWVSNRPLDKDFIRQFNKALQMGLAHIPQLIYLLPTPANQAFDLHTYFTQYISYDLSPQKRKALKLFLKELSNNQLQSSLLQSLA